MKLKYYIFLLFILPLFSACEDYLDIVPDELATEEDAFKTPETTKRYLYSCYGYLPNFRLGNSLDMLSNDETLSLLSQQKTMTEGNYTPTSPGVTYWNQLYQGLRQSYLLLENIDKTPNMNLDERQQYKAEATFLVGYYHYLVLRIYGPAILFNSLPALDLPMEEWPERSTYDECVAFISAKFDEALSYKLASDPQKQALPREQSNLNLGRINSVAVEAIRARMYLYAASPLFNGGKPLPVGDGAGVVEGDDVSNEYKAFRNLNGEELISTTFSQEKWVKAAEACKNAIDVAESGSPKYTLYTKYTSNVDGFPIKNEVYKATRMTFCDIYNKELIWQETRREVADGGFQRASAPRASAGRPWNAIAPTLAIVEAFYTENGLPIDEDPAFNYSDRYLFSAMPADYNVANLEIGEGVTMNLHMHREPRFYSWISFHNGYYEMDRNSNPETDKTANTYVDGWRIKTQYRMNDFHGFKGRSDNYSLTGYLNKKGVSYMYKWVSTSANTDNRPVYHWPIIRLAELYLNYAEALIECNQLEEAKVWINKVRSRAGVPDIDTAWAPTGKTLTQAKMRQIVRQERTIEFYMENQRFYDVRRWLLGTKYFNVSLYGMNISGVDDANFFKKTILVSPRKFLKPAHYLMPIPQNDVDNSPSLKQNPGYF